MPWWLWLIMGIAALAGESVSMALFLLYFGIAAFVAMLLAAANIAVGLQIGVFFCLSLALIGLVRPRMLARLSRPIPAALLTNHGKLMDRIGIVEQPISAQNGLIRIGSGEFWTARPYPPTTAIPAGIEVRVMYIDGVTAYVAPLSEEARPRSLHASSTSADDLMQPPNSALPDQEEHLSV